MNPFRRLAIAFVSRGLLHSASRPRPAHHRDRSGQRRQAVLRRAPVRGSTEVLRSIDVPQEREPRPVVRLDRALHGGMWGDV
jgi:hypothetical protein